MRGVQNIIRMRSMGLKPSVVWVELEPVQQWARQLTEQEGRHVDIQPTPAEIAAFDLQDLRCLKGIAHVLVSGPANASTERVGRACQKAGAKVVEVFFFDRSKPYAEQVTKAMRLTQEEERVVCLT